MKNIIIIAIGFALCNINMGLAQSYQLVTNVKTPNNSTVQDTYSLTSADISQNSGQIAAYEAFVNSFGAVLIEPQSYKYNCHGYAWNVVEGGSKVWIGRYTTTAEDIYWTDGSYMEVTESNATKVSYHQAGNHSAIKLDSHWYQSKWGWGGGLVKHTLIGIPSTYQPSMAKKFYRKTPTLTGPTLVLNAGSTYTLSNTNGATVTWTCSSNLQKLSSSGASATFKAVYAVTNAPGWIQASVNGISTPRYEVWVGKPVITGIRGDKNIPIYNYALFSAEYDYKAAIPNNGFQWVLTPLNSNSINGATTGFVDIAFYDTGSYQLVVRATNANGTGEYYVTGVSVYDPSSYSSASTSLYQVYPNPVSDELTVNLRTQLSSVPIQSSGGSQTVGNNAYTVYLYNANGVSVRQVFSQGGDQVQLDVSGLPAGIYYLLIDSGNGNKPETHKIIVKH